MEMNIIKQKEVPLLSRDRVALEISYTGATPSRMQIREELAKKIKAHQDNVIIRHIYSKFGDQKSKVIAHVYSDKIILRKLEPKSLLRKHFPEEYKEEAKQPKAEKKEAAKPKEEKAEKK